MTFKEEILQGIPDILPEPKPYDQSVNHAPKRKDILTKQEKVLAIKNALRYFPEKHHALLAKEFAEELKNYGRIYMYRFRPSYEMYARPVDEYPARSRQAAGIMAMIQNNLDPRVAQHPHELINRNSLRDISISFRLRMRLPGLLTTLCRSPFWDLIQRHVLRSRKEN